MVGSVPETSKATMFSVEACKLAFESKELFVVRSTGHVDLYDRVNLIPWDKLTSLFNKHLTQGVIR